MRYIEVYRATAKEYLDIAGGNNFFLFSLEKISQIIALQNTIVNAYF